MGLFSKIFGAERKAYDTTVFEAVLAQGGVNAAGINVTPTLALNCTTVAAGVRVRVETLGSLSLLLYKRGHDDERSRATEHPLYRLLHDRPNSFTSAAEFVMQLESDVILEGEGFALANRAEGRIVELLRLNPINVTCKHDDDTLEPYYEVRNKAGRMRRYEWPDILHIRGSIDLANNKNGRPLSALRQASQAIGLAMALEGHAARIMSKSARPGGALNKGVKKMDDVAWKRVLQSWQGHTGQQAGGVAILEEGMTFTPLTFSSVDLQFAEMRIFQTVEISRALGTPPTLIYEMGRATFANSEELAQNSRPSLCLDVVNSGKGRSPGCSRKRNRPSIIPNSRSTRWSRPISAPAMRRTPRHAADPGSRPTRPAPLTTEPASKAATCCGRPQTPSVLRLQQQRRRSPNRSRWPHERTNRIQGKAVRQRCWRVERDRVAFRHR